MKLWYKTDENIWFDYDADNSEVDKRLHKWMRENYSREELIDYIISADGCKVDLHKEFEDIITELFKDTAEEWYEGLYDD